MARYQKQRVQYPIGTVSSGTMRPEDLIPDFVWEVRQHEGESCYRKAKHGKLTRGILYRMKAEQYYDSEQADYDLEALFDALGEYAGPYFYFGSHPGNGADYGYWLSEGFEKGFDGVKVSDTSLIPRKYRGEVLHVNDHGNATLYVQTSRGLHEIWAVV